MKAEVAHVLRTENQRVTDYRTMDSMVLKSVFKTIAAHWIEENKVEVLWVVINQDIPQQKAEVLEHLFEAFKAELNNSDTMRFDKFKELLVNTTDEQTSQAFKVFYLWLLDGKTKAWRRFEQTLSRLVPVFLKSVCLRKSWEIPDDCDLIYYESRVVFVKNMSSDTLSFKNSGKLKSYVFGIAYNKLMEYYREKRKQRIMDHTGNNEIPDSAYNGSETFENLDQYNRILKVLNDKEKAIITAYYKHGYAFKEIGEMMKLTEGNCRKIKHEAMRKLKQEYNKLKSYSDGM